MEGNIEETKTFFAEFIFSVVTTSQACTTVFMAKVLHLCYHVFASNNFSVLKRGNFQ